MGGARGGRGGKVWSIGRGFHTLSGHLLLLVQGSPSLEVPLQYFLSIENINFDFSVYFKA